MKGNILVGLWVCFCTLAFRPYLCRAQAMEDRGFIHPGGLHVQADFERIKQQLSDGHPEVTAAYRILQEAAYAQSSAVSYPVETIIRGGSGENYINAARGAAIAYQNALRWKIEGNEACAAHAVSVLMAWANTCKGIGGNSNWALAAGLYGYEFAQAAELMRDYEGWKPEDFHTFRRWMLEVWYPANIAFLRGRNGTWENAGKWWQAPGHYWSNWGLCNALSLISIGVLCDDVFLYNQGMSFIKYDQCGTFQNPRTESPILNNGLTEFWGNLIVTTTEWEEETGAYGKVGQMNESGRDTGHAAMALGLAVDIAHMAWNQGDDLFSFMEHRLAAGIEYVAAQCKSIATLPWTPYHYASTGYYYSDSRSWIMTEPALGAQIRSYWGTVIGHYEGVKGIRMPFSEWACSQMGIDDGGAGGTSGDYDHLGYSILLNTYGTEKYALNPNPPVELLPQISYNGQTIERNELGGLVNTFTVTPVNNRALAVGTELTLSPQLPQGVTDTGKWQWNTGETTRQITVTANHSFVYRVSYTNEQGVTSSLCFPIAVQEDTHPSKVVARITVGDTTVADSVIAVTAGSTVTLSLEGVGGYGNYQWENGGTSGSITLTNVQKNQTITGTFQNQGGRKTSCTFTLYVNPYESDPDRVAANGKYRLHHIPTDTYLTNVGDSAVFAPLVAEEERSQVWETIYNSRNSRYTLVSALNNKVLLDTGKFHNVKVPLHVFTFAQGCDRCIMGDRDGLYWCIEGGEPLVCTKIPYLYDFPFELLPYVDEGDAVSAPQSAAANVAHYVSMDGVMRTWPVRGLNIVRMTDGTVKKMVK